MSGQPRQGIKHGHAPSNDGSRRATPTYVSWRRMKSRCTNPNHDRFARYGGAGVAVCERWMTFANFLHDMGERPEGTTLGRILDLGNYEPGSVFWMTPKEQGLARRNRRVLLNSGFIPTPTRNEVYAA